jgi:hypothetical protein
MRSGMNESADESDLECLRSPVTDEHMSYQVELTGPTEDDLAAIKNAYDFIPRSSVGFNF